MDKNFVRSIIDSVVNEFLEGGPGSGRYPKGSSGKSSDGGDTNAGADITLKPGRKGPGGGGIDWNDKNTKESKEIDKAIRQDGLDFGKSHREKERNDFLKTSDPKKDFKEYKLLADEMSRKAFEKGTPKAHVQASDAHSWAASVAKAQGKSDEAAHHDDMSRAHEFHRTGMNVPWVPKMLKDKKEELKNTPERSHPRMDMWGEEPSSRKSKKTFRIPKTKKAKKYNTDMSNDPFSDTE